MKLTLTIPLSLRRLQHLSPADLLPFLYLFAMLLVSPPLTAVPLFLYLWVAHSFFFHYLGLTGAHHHPDIFHDGDAAR